MNDLVLARPSTPAVPALIAAAGERAAHALPRILRRQHPQPAHAAGLLPRGRGISDLVRERRRAVDRRRPAGARRDLDRGVDARAGRADRSSSGSRRFATCSTGW